MSVLVLAVLILAAVGHSADAAWCVCRSDVSDSALQKAIDYACGAGADCTPILQNGVCFQPNTIRAHCSYAVNSYFQKKGQAQGSCEFSNSATVSSTDPSPGGSCTFPSSASPGGGGATTVSPPSTTTPPGSTTPGGSTTTPGGSTTTPGGGSTSTPGGSTSTLTPPSSFTPTNGGMIGGGIGTSLGPSGAGGINTDTSDGVFSFQNTNLISFLLTLWFLALICFWV